MADTEEKSWSERLGDACLYEGDSFQEEDDYCRSLASQAPIKELELFLRTANQRYMDRGKQVMAQVYEDRVSRELERRKNKDWWRGLFQHFWAQLLSGFVLGVIASFMAFKTWLCN